MSDIQIAGATFTDVPSIQVPKVGGGMATYTEGGGPTILKYGVLRPDATLFTAHTYDKYIHANEGVTIPSYTTTSTTLKASAALSRTCEVNYDYDWFILIRCLTIPEYSNSVAVSKGRASWHFTSALYELVTFPEGSFSAIDSNVSTTSRTSSLVATGAFSRLIYWTSASAVTAYSTAAYGTAQSIVAPTLSSGVITFNSPNLNIRGHSTYFTSTHFNALTDIRYQWVIDVYRAPKNNLNLDGFNQETHAQHIVSCAQSANHKLT